MNIDTVGALEALKKWSHLGKSSNPPDFSHHHQKYFYCLFCFSGHSNFFKTVKRLVEVVTTSPCLDLFPSFTLFWRLPLHKCYNLVHLRCPDHTTKDFYDKAKVLATLSLVPCDKLFIVILKQITKKNIAESNKVGIKLEKLELEIFWRHKRLSRH